MNTKYDDLTIKEAREIACMFGGGLAQDDGGVAHGAGLRDGFIGKYVICRTRNEGINAGKVIALDETGVILDDARRLYYHKPVNKNVSWYEGVAKYGISSDSLMGVAIQKIISEDYSLTLCTNTAEQSIRGAKDNEQS